MTEKVTKEEALADKANEPVEEISPIMARNSLARGINEALLANFSQHNPAKAHGLTPVVAVALTSISDSLSKIAVYDIYNERHWLSIMDNCTEVVAFFREAKEKFEKQQKTEKGNEND